MAYGSPLAAFGMAADEGLDEVAGLGRRAVGRAASAALSFVGGFSGALSMHMNIAVDPIALATLLAATRSGVAEVTLKVAATAQNKTRSFMGGNG